MSERKKWPEDYQAWEGNFDQLVAEASNILRHVEPEAEPPTTSLVRYYQQQGVVGRGHKKGRSSTFGFDNLAQVVAAKQMVNQQVPLAMAKAVFDNMDTMTSSAPDMAGVGYYTNSPAASASMAISNSLEGKKNPAENLVARLLAQNCVDKSYPGNTALRGMATQNAFAGLIRSIPDLHLPTPTVVAPMPLVSQNYNLAEGVSVQLSQTNDPAAQARVLRELADKIQPPTRSKKS